MAQSQSPISLLPRVHLGANRDQLLRKQCCSFSAYASGKRFGVESIGREAASTLPDTIWALLREESQFFEEFKETVIRELSSLTDADDGAVHAQEIACADVQSALAPIDR